MPCIMPSVFLLCHFADDLIIDQSINASCRNSALWVTVSHISSFSFLRVLLVYHHLLQRHKVKLGAGKFSMKSFGTILAGIDLELIDYCSILIAHKTEVVIVHLRFLQVLYQIFIFKVINDRVLQRFYLIVWSPPCQKLKSQQERLLYILDLHSVDYHIVEVTASLFGSKANLSLPQDQKVVLIVQPTQGLLWMADAHLDVLGKGIKRLIYQIAKECQMVKNASIALFQVLLLEIRRQFMQKIVLLFQIELFANIDALFNIMVDLPFQLASEFVLVRQLFECLVVFALFDVSGPDVADEGAHRVDVIRQAHHAEDLNHDQAECFLVGVGYDVSKANSEHDGGSPVVGPSVLFEPRGILYAFDCLPAGTIGIDVSHGGKCDCQQMGEAKIKQNDLNQRPILLVVIIFDEKGLQLLHLLQALWQFSNNKQPQVLQFFESGPAVNQQNQQTHQIDYHICLQVMPQYLLVSYKFFTCIGFHSCAVIDNLDQIKKNRKVLKRANEGSR